MSEWTIYKKVCEDRQRRNRKTQVLVLIDREQLDHELRMLLKSKGASIATIDNEGIPFESAEA